VSRKRREPHDESDASMLEYAIMLSIVLVALLALVALTR
jgi:Flp pilus assembly pilin Flp